MTEPDSREPQNRIFWHPLLVLVLERFLPEGWKLLPEFLLGRMPQRIDIVVLRLIEQAGGTARRLHSIFDHLRPHTLIEYKGPTDDLDGADAITLIGYAMQYMVLSKLDDPGELCLMVIADRIPPSFPEQIQRFGGRFEPQGGGLWRGDVGRLTLHGVETRAALEGGPTEQLLYAFSRAFLKDPLGQKMPLDDEDLRVYTALYEQIARSRRTTGTMATKDIEAAEKGYVEVLKSWLKTVPRDKLPDFLSPDLLQELTPEQRLAGLTSEQILEALSPDVRDALARKLHH